MKNLLIIIYTFFLISSSNLAYSAIIEKKTISNFVDQDECLKAILSGKIFDTKQFPENYSHIWIIYNQHMYKVYHSDDFDEIECKSKHELIK